MEIHKERICIHKNELIDTFQVIEKGRVRFYSYTYKLVDKKGTLRPFIRWDNFEHDPHVDKYDENSALIEQKNCQEKNAQEVVKLVNIFRKNLLAMNVAEL